MKINFRRSTLSTDFIPEIDGLRFLAIITVVIFHLNTAFSKEMGLGEDLGVAALGGKQNLLQLGWWIIRLDLGVKVFFAISGFVLALPFLKQHLNISSKPINLTQYYIRRLTRLEPPFVISLVLFTLVHMFVMKHSWGSLDSHFWAGLFYMHVFVFGDPNPINPVTWSLETEAQFYILVPLLFAIAFSVGNKQFRLIIVAVVFLCAVFMKGYLLRNHIDRLSESILAYLPNFMTGIVFAYLYVTDKAKTFNKRTSAWDLAGIFAVLLIFYFYKPQALWYNNILFNCGIFILMVSAFKGKLLNAFFRKKFIYITGGMCYSIYLLHYAFFHLLVKYTAHLSSWPDYKLNLALQLLIALPLVLFISGIFFLLIEKPCMNKHWPVQLAGYFLKETKRADTKLQ